MKNESFIQNYIMRDMSEGVMVIGFDGVVSFLNPAAAQIFACDAKEVVGVPFAVSFFEYEENDEFNQMILNAVYDRDNTHEGIVDYFTGSETRQLHVTTSFLKNDEQAIGIVCVIDDVSELSELRDALKAMERIKKINSQLEIRNKLLSETFGRFLSDEIVHQLLETPDGLALGGKKRMVTVMMSDLRGFTALSERMEPHALINMLNHYLGVMTEIIEHRNGTIIEFVGDGIIAIFGAPVLSEQHAAEAVAAALEMELRMKEVNEWNTAHGYPELQMGIGINTGEVIVGNIGSEIRTKYGVIGSHVNLAGRIESYTVGGQVLVSPATCSCIDSELTIVSEQEVLPKGINDPLTLSHITGIGAPFDVYYKADEEPMEKLTKRVDAPFLCIHEKHVDEVENLGCFIKLSHSGGVLQTELMLEKFLNLQLNIGGKLFAKVLDKTDEGYVLRFTSLPTCFDSWYGEAIQ